jgi:hypothetical protein
MKLTIIKPDSTVYVDNLCYFNIDMSWIPQMNGVDVHAVQWNGDIGKGEIELSDASENILITELGIFQKAVDLWEEKRQEHLEHEKQLELVRIKEMEIDLAYKKHLEESELEFVENDAIYYNLEDLLREI